jgi:thiamine biosynthesis lipoprotein
MGLPVSLHIRGPEARGPRIAPAVAELFAALRADDTMFSTWKPDSPISRIRRGEERLENAHPRIRKVAELCEEAERRTEGAFSAWLPGPDGSRLFDPTGLVKGFSVQQAFDKLLDRLEALGEHDALVAAGGDIALACTRSDTPDWNVGISNPRQTNQTLLSIPLRRGAVATSGVAARGEHIVNPATGTPPVGLLSATVVGPDLTWADVYATAAFVRGEQAIEWLSALPDHAGILVLTDGTIRTT